MSWPVCHIGPTRATTPIIEVIDGIEDVQPAPPEPESSPLLVPGELYASSGIKRLPLWAPRWSAVELARRRDANLRSFQRAFGQQPIGDHEFVFNAAAVDLCVDRTLTLGMLPTDKKGYLFVAGIDPAGTGKSKLTAFWVLMVLAISRSMEHRYLVALERWRGLQIDDHKGIIRRVYEQHPWTACHVEGNNTQSLLLNEYAKTGAPMKLINTTAEKHVQMEMMGAEFARGLWHLPFNARVQEFIAELKAYPTGRFHDTIEAARLAWLAAQAMPKKTGGPQIACLDVGSGTWT